MAKTEKEHGNEVFESSFYQPAPVYSSN